MPKYQVLNTETKETKEYEVPVLRPAGILPVPYISQLGPGANKYNSDCGAACGTMLLKAYNLSNDMTVDRFYDETGQGAIGGFLGVGHLQQVMGKYGLTSDFRANMSMGDVFDLLAQQRPTILLFKYGVLVDAKLTERKDFKGAHFALAVGMDNKYIYIHDPYWSGNNGEARPYPADVFLDSWIKVGQDEKMPNPQRAGIMPRMGLNQAPKPIIPGEPSIPSIGGKGSAANTKPIYRVRVVHPQFINIRTGAGMNFTDIGDVMNGDQRDVYEEKKEAGSTNVWGRIHPSDQQWILVRDDTAVKI